MFVDELPEGSSQFDLLCSYMRLDLREVRKVMPQNTVFITLLRDPIKTFESVFGYYASTVPAFFIARQAAANEGKSALSVFLDSQRSSGIRGNLGTVLPRTQWALTWGSLTRSGTVPGRRTWSKSFIWWWSQRTLMSPWFSWGSSRTGAWGFGLPSAQCSCRQQRDGAGREHAGEIAIVERAGHAALRLLYAGVWKKAAQLGWRG